MLKARGGTFDPERDVLWGLSHGTVLEGHLWGKMTNVLGNFQGQTRPTFPKLLFLDILLQVMYALIICYSVFLLQVRSTVLGSTRFHYEINMSCIERKCN